MAFDASGESYRRRVQLFAQNYCERHGQRTFHVETGVPESTISQSLYKENGFGPGNHRKIVRWIEKVATELHEQGMPLQLDYIDLPLESDVLRRLGVHADAAEGTRGEIAATEGEIPGTGEVSSEESLGDVLDDKGSDETKVVVPQGVSITLPELRGKAAELWNRPYLFGDDLVSEDLERVFAISLSTTAGSDDAKAGWTGPNPPEDLDFQLDEQMHARLDELLEQWQRHAFAYEIIKDVPRFSGHYTFLYIRRRMLEIEVVLIEDFWLTHPESEIPWQNIQRHRELEWRHEVIQKLHRVEYQTNLEILMIVAIWVGKTLLVAPVRGAARLLGRIFRRPQRNATGS